jgi:hypothetical protein
VCSLRVKVLFEGLGCVMCSSWGRDVWSRSEAEALLCGGIALWGVTLVRGLVQLMMCLSVCFLMLFLVHGFC